MMSLALLIALIVALVPFALPIISLISLSALRRRIDELEASLAAQRRAMSDLQQRVIDAERRAASPPAAAAPAQVTARVTSPAVAVPSGPVTTPTPPSAPTSLPPVRPIDRPLSESAPTLNAGAVPPPPVSPVPPTASPAPSESLPALLGDLISRIGARVKPGLDLGASLKSFDWEQLVGVRLFSAVAGVALVLAAIFFLRYSLDRGWLSPTVRVAIGVMVGTALLVVCELRAAHRYRVTANALDAAAVGILFSTFFAAHALWQLIPSTITFGLLALVTVIAVLLSIRHDSVFIAVLGLIGGFATPALLSTGENRPIPLFTYLLLLNIGLAWVAVRKSWPVLTVLTLILTTIYQWGWVASYLAVSDVRLGMGVFVLFAIVSFVALTLGRQAPGGRTAGALEHLGLAASVMPLAFAVFLAAVPRYGSNTGLLFGFLSLIVVGLSVVAAARRDDRLHAAGALASVLVFAVWVSASYASTGWRVAVVFAGLLSVFFAVAPIVARRLGRPLGPLADRCAYAAPVLLVVFPVIVYRESEAAMPLFPFAVLFVALAVVAWRALEIRDSVLYLVGAFFSVAAQASWSATHLTPERLGAQVGLSTVFALMHLGVPLVWRRRGQAMTPSWGSGALLLGSLVLLLFLVFGPQSTAALWGMALLLAILNAGLFVESASGSLPILSAVGAALSWVVMALWWQRSAGVVGLLPSLLVVVGLTLVMLGGYVWAQSSARPHSAPIRRGGLSFRQSVFLALVGQLFLVFVAGDPTWGAPPWPWLGALAVMTLATTAAALRTDFPDLHAAGVAAAAVVALAFAAQAARGWAVTAVAVTEATIAFGVLWLWPHTSVRARPPWVERGAIGAVVALFIGELALGNAAVNGGFTLMWASLVAHACNIALLLFIAWRGRWPQVGVAAVLPAWWATSMWHRDHVGPIEWQGMLALAAAAYAVFAAYPLVLNQRARDARGPYVTAVLASVAFFFVARRAFVDGGLQAYLGVVPIVAGMVLALLLRQLLRAQPSEERDLGRLALVAAAALGFATVAIPLQLENQWVTIGWALEGAALAWLYRRVPHRGLLFASSVLLATVFVRLALNPAIFVYEPRGAMRLLNWYLYAYASSAGAMLVAAKWFAPTDDRVMPWLPRASTWLPALAVVLLFILVNIEVADFYATGPAITFRFGATLAQDLTYTMCWAAFGLGLLAAGISLHNRYARMAAVALMAVTTSKAFLYDMGSLGGLYRVGSLVGLAISLSLVALALQKFVLQSPKEQQP